MGALSQIVSRVAGGGRTAGRTRTGGGGLGRAAARGAATRGTGRRTSGGMQGEAVNRGVRSLLRRAR